MQRTFLWGGKEEKQKWALVNQDTVCTPKLNGGLGLRDPKNNNYIMGAKIWWRWIKHEQEPWAKLWLRKYAPGWDKQNLVRFDENIKGSPIWKATSNQRSIIQKHSFWEIRNGNLASFFTDAWQQLQLVNQILVAPNLETTLGDRGMLKVKDMWKDETSPSQFKHWKDKD